MALEDSYRESTESWLALLRDLKNRGMRAPVVAAGDGALGFWAAICEVFPETLEERCWVHKIANVLDKLPRRLDGHELLPLVRAGVQLRDGVRVEREDDQVPVFPKKRLTVNTGKRGKIAA